DSRRDHDAGLPDHGGCAAARRGHRDWHAPGGTQRRAIGNAVQRMSVAEITQVAPVNTFQELLSGRTPGIRFSVVSGNVGSGQQVTLRGVGSFDMGRNQPLIFVDGIRVNNDTEAGPEVAEASGVVNVLNDFNPDDIESIEIIKGPAAATLYGSEASAGVIQILTKKGNEGAPEFTLTVRQGANFMIDPAGKLGTQWTCPVNPSPSPDCATQESLEQYNMYDEATRYIREGYFDWETPELFSSGHTQGYS
ncbi:MAG: TonB-dependent receptor plug domain-containing protein, partial [Gemmatimonas sp.]|nr:TonB-dependent receptor plug domain-containing protein [Gemmatimonas sp.]